MPIQKITGRRNKQARASRKQPAGAQRPPCRPEHFTVAKEGMGAPRRPKICGASLGKFREHRGPCLSICRRQGGNGRRGLLQIGRRHPAPCHHERHWRNSLARVPSPDLPPRAHRDTWRKRLICKHRQVHRRKIMTKARLGQLKRFDRAAGMIGPSITRTFHPFETKCTAAAKTIMAPHQSPPHHTYPPLSLLNPIFCKLYLYAYIFAFLLQKPALGHRHKIEPRLDISCHDQRERNMRAS